MMTGGNNYLQLDPTHFNGARHYDDLPENFLETVSPHNTGPPLSLPSHHDPGSHLAGLNTMSVAGSDYSYTSMVSMGGSSYSSVMKSEMGGHPSPLEKFHRFSGPASLLSPLQLDNRDPSGLLGITRNGRASEMLSSLRTTNTYVKEEMTSDLGYNQEYDVSTMYLPSQQELERMTAATPPAISGDLLGNSCMSGEVVQYEVATSQAYLPQNHQQLRQSQVLQQQPQTTSRRSRARKNNNQQQLQQHSNNNQNNAGPSSNEDHNSMSQQQQSRQPRATGNMGPGAGVPRAVYSTTDTTDPLNAEIDDDIYIDTKDLCKRIAYELKQHSIPQAIFAERILCRSQGTLSDLLRNPKPWNRLKSGRETFRRMFNWVQQPLHVRLSILDMYKGPMGSSSTPTSQVMLSPPTPAQNARQNSRARLATDDSGGSAKRPRLVFTDIQKRTLQAIFKETQRPSREMQQTIAEHLRLDMSTVSNFFMNARRRSRNGNVIDDEPTPFQHIRPITPPPDSPSSTPRSNMHSTRTRSFRSPHNGAMPEHIDEAVSAVAHGTTASHSSHSSPQDLISPDGGYSEMLNPSVVDGLDNNWDSVDIKPNAADFMTTQYSVEDSPTQHQESDVFVSPRSAEPVFHMTNGNNQSKNLTQLFSNDNKPASAPGSVRFT